MVEGLKGHPALAFWEVVNEAEGSFTPHEVKTVYQKQFQLSEYFFFPRGFICWTIDEHIILEEWSVKVTGFARETRCNRLSVK